MVFYVNGNFERVLRKLKQHFERTLKGELRRHEFFLSRSEGRRLKDARAKKQETEEEERT